MTWKTLAFIAISAPVIAVAALTQQTQQGGAMRTKLQTIDFPPGFETVTVIGEIRSATAPADTLILAETAYVLEGGIVVKIDGKPGFFVKAGEPLLFASGVVHNECNLQRSAVQSSRHLCCGKEQAADVSRSVRSTGLPLATLPPEERS
jgi:hypothetical protein